MLKTKDLASFISPDLSIGPFGVLKLNVMAQEKKTCVNQRAKFGDSVDDLQTTPSSIGPLDPILNFGDTLHWADLFELDFESILMTQELTNGTKSPNLATDMSAPTFNDGQFARHTDLSPNYDLETQSPTQNRSTGIELEYSPATLSDASSVQEAQYLLKHFQDCVVPQMSFMPASSKSPWRTLNLLEAVHTWLKWPTCAPET